VTHDRTEEPLPVTETGLAGQTAPSPDGLPKREALETRDAPAAKGELPPTSSCST
jgi:hypothetical protein